MFFWIMDLLIPFMMIMIGIIFLLRKPKHINYLVGYRTRMSMKSQETWNYAHQAYGKILIIIGPLLMILIIISKLTVPISKDLLSLIHVGIGLVFFIVPVIFVEIALRRHFDKNGIKKD